MKALPRLVVAAVFFVNVAGVLAEDAITLRQRWQDGKRYSNTIKLYQSMRLSSEAMTMEQKTAMAMETSMAVSAHEDGKNQRLDLKFERLVMHATSNGQTMDVDSARPEEATGPLGNLFAGLVGKEIRAVATPRGKVLEVENAEEILPRGDDPGEGTMFQKQSIINLLDQSRLQSLPPGPIKPGDSWPYALEMPVQGLGDITIKGTYTFKGMAPHGGVPCAKIRFDGVVAMAGSAPVPGASFLSLLGMKLTAGSVEGTTWFDNTLGALRGSNINQTMTLSAPDPADPASTLTTSITQHVSVELTKAEAIR